MKRIIFAIVMLIPVLLLSYTVPVNNSLDSGVSITSQSSKGVTLTYSMEQFQIEDVLVNSDTLQKVLVEKCFLPGQAGAPDLPSISTYLALPQGATASVNITNYETVCYQNIDLAPAFEIPNETDDSLNYFYDNSIYLINAFYPDNFWLLGDNDLIRGVDCCPFAFMPFQYNPITDELIVYYDIQIEISFSGGNGHFGEDRLRSRWWEPINHSFFINSESLPEIDFDEVNTQRPGEYEYIIIIPENGEFLTAAETLKDFRTKQGIKTGIFQIGQEIASNTVEAIENFLDDAYDSWEMKPVAFLFVGDYHDENLEENDIITSIYYYYLNNSTFLMNSDNLFADVNGNHLPDLIPARITPHNASEAMSQINKIIDYESEPPDYPEFYDTPLLSSAWEQDRWFTLFTEVLFGFYENELAKNPIREYSIVSGVPGELWSTNTNTQMVVDYFGTGNNGLNYLLISNPAELGGVGSYVWNSNAERINQDINTGTFLALHRDHGSSIGWVHPEYILDDLDELNNNALPVIISINCWSGNFGHNNGDCFSESIMGREGGALGVIGATRTTCPFVNDVYGWGIFDSLWPQFLIDYSSELVSFFIKPALANNYAKYFLQQNNWPNNPDEKERTYNLYHYLGGAFTELFTELPQELNVEYDQYLNHTDTSLDVYVNNKALVCLSINNETTGNEIIDTAISRFGFAHLEFDQLPVGSILDLVITKRNYIRHESNVYGGGANITGEVVLPDYQDNSGIVAKLFNHSDDLIDISETDLDGVYRFYNISSGEFYIQYSINDFEKPHYTCISEYFTYDNSTGTQELPLVEMDKINPEMILVSQNPETPSFDYLQDAVIFTNDYINSEFYSDEEIRIYLTAGSYETPNHEMYYLLNTANSDMIKVSINGISNVEFSPFYNQGDNVDDPFFFLLGNINLEINNITFSQYSTAINIEGLFNSSLTISGCVFEDNGLYWSESANQYQSFSSGGAIEFENHCGGFGDFQFIVDNCSFINNSVSIGYNQSASISSMPLDNGFGGAICIDLRQCDYDNMDIKINDNTFSGNSANYGGAVFLNNVENALIANNDFSYNGFVIIDESEPTHYAKKGATLSVIDSEVKIEGNTFYENDNISIDGDIYGQYVNWFLECNEIKSSNNSYVSNDDLSCIFIEDASNCTLTNDIYCEYSDDPDFAVSIDDSPYEISYCITYGDFNQNYIVDGTGSVSYCLECDPELDNDCIPVWDSVSISPCIDAGNPDTDGDGDLWYEDIDDQDASDCTRLDIGAKCVENHDQYYTTLPQGGSFNVKWMCFPAVNDRTNNMDQYINVVPELLVPIEEYSPLEQIRWLPIEQEEPQMELVEWLDTYWSNEDYLVDPAQGFVFTMDGNDPTYLEVSGFNESPDREITLYAGQENWVGYFLEEKQSYFGAIQDFEDDLYIVKGQYHTIAKIDGHWVGNISEPLEYGDMVKIFTTADIDFQWHNPAGGGGTTKESQQATNYTWTEEEDYIPVIVAFDDTTLPLEIGVYADEECKGAAVVEDSTCILCTYITDDPGADLSFDLYYGRNMKTERIKPRNIIYDKENRYIRVSLDEEPDNLPIPVELSLTNYPNPFNPSTMIEYAIKEACQVELSVYNIKGQLVRTLVNELRDPGYYQIIWDGKDNQGSTCASGIYFSQMKAGKEVIRDRMMLIK
ncbi:MAG: T9SS type A sorting domain-containing protein [Candidatus Cloacimonetes bacterium]|nr:T9SS type A sorting domain-containing protein [Candidatus Cloacimonadota bacterium]